MNKPGSSRGLSKAPVSKPPKKPESIISAQPTPSSQTASQTQESEDVGEWPSGQREEDDTEGISAALSTTQEPEGDLSQPSESLSETNMTHTPKDTVSPQSER
jgi:hypothetical protein